PEVVIGADTVIGPNVQLRGKTRIGSGCRLDGSAYLQDATLGDRVHVLFSCVVEEAEVGDDARVGPFARLRPGTKLAERVHIGNFVETKKAAIGAGAKANHLTYLGDCEVGADAYVGAGTTVTRDVPPGALVVSRVPQRHVEGWTARRKAMAAGTPPPPRKKKPARPRSRRKTAAKARRRR